MAESDKKKILATIFCLKEDSAYDDKARFNEFWAPLEQRKSGLLRQVTS
jgi:hypothetical protein